MRSLPRKCSNPSRKSASRRPVLQTHRPLHRRVSLHPVSIFLLLCVGVLMLISSFRAMAASTQLTMKIRALPLSAPAVITQPVDQARLTVPDVTVRGTCPSDSYVKIFRNDIFSGAAMCNEGKFELLLTLSAGANTLLAKVYNYTDDEGPASPSITVYYDKPASAQTRVPASSRPATVRASLPLRIITDYRYSVYQNAQAVRLNLGLAGGVAPYAVAIDWGDGHISPISRSDTSSFDISHTYPEKSRLHTYVIKIAGSDASGNTAYIQLMAVVDGKTPAVTATTQPPAPTGNRFYDRLQYFWLAYLIVVLMVISFWLGEREERRILLGRRKATFNG